jgi:hypothetical protein
LATLYHVLGVPTNASQETIRLAYRGLAKQYHPDSNTSTLALARFQRINEAHRVLSDPQLRREYDLQLLLARRLHLARTNTDQAQDVLPKQPLQNAAQQALRAEQRRAQKLQERKNLRRAWLVLSSVVVLFTIVILVASRYLIRPSARMDLSYRGLTEWPKGLSGSTEIRVLDLSHNKFAAMPAEVGTLGELYLLKANGNGFTDVPRGIYSLPYLTGLHLSENRLTEISPLVGGLPTLRVLNLRNNRLHTLPHTTSKLKQLQELDLRGNPISYDTLAVLRKRLPKTEILHDR